MKKLLIVILLLIITLPCYAKKEFNFDEIHQQITNYEKEKDYKNAFRLVCKIKKKKLTELQNDLLNIHKDICLENIFSERNIDIFNVENDIYNDRKIYQYPTNTLLFFKPKIIAYKDKIDVSIKLDLKYIGRTYYNFQNGVININNKNYRFTLKNAGESVSSCDSTGCIYHEYRIIQGIDELNLLKEISHNGNTTIRFYGTNYYKDYVLVKNHLVSVDASLALYYYLKRNLNNQ